MLIEIRSVQNYSRVVKKAICLNAHLSSCFPGDYSQVRGMIDDGANVNTTFKYGTSSLSILDWAIFHGNLLNFEKNNGQKRF